MNMSYCRFQNTLIDLKDCDAALQEMAEQSGDDLSREEQIAAVALIELCAKITANAIEAIRRPGPQSLDADDVADGGKREYLKRLVAGEPVHEDEEAAAPESTDTPQHPQRAAVVRLLEALQAAGFHTRKVDDGGEVFNTGTPPEAAEVIISVDVSEVYFLDPFGGGDLWAKIVLGNADSEIVCDHTCRQNQGGDLFTATISAFADAEEAR